MKKELKPLTVIGLMSGTSVDGIDAVITTVSGQIQDLRVSVQAWDTYAYPQELREKILAVAAGQALSMEEFATLDDQIAQEFAKAALTIQTKLTHGEKVNLIGSHGQTVFHRPPISTEQERQIGYSLQLGRGEVIAASTKVPTVSNFRQADIAMGGQGAPLVSRIDLCLLGDPVKNRCVQNIGGIGNVTYLPAYSSSPILGEGVLGWDTGPGNVLIDLAVSHFSNAQQSYDKDGAWAKSGKPDIELVESWLNDSYFQLTPPKSTGRELFGPTYLGMCLSTGSHLTAADMIATLTEFTAASIAKSYQDFLTEMPDEVLLCGGGALNQYLFERIQAWLPGITVMTTEKFGVPVESKEAIAFAILAYWKYYDLPGNLPSVTGASSEIPLGQIIGLEMVE